MTAPPLRPTCFRCAAPISSPVWLVEVSRQAKGRDTPERHRYTLCGRCEAAHREWIRSRPA